MRCNNRLCEDNSRYNNDGCNKLGYALSQEKCETKKRWRKEIPLDSLLGKASPKADVLFAEIVQDLAQIEYSASIMKRNIKTLIKHENYTAEEYGKELKDGRIKLAKILCEKTEISYCAEQEILKKHCSKLFEIDIANKTA